MLLLTFFAFLAGIITILSPCILPVLPIVLSGSVGGKRRPYGIVTGFILSFSLFTLTLSTLVQRLNLSPGFLRWVALIILIAFGLTLLVPKLQQKFEIITSSLVKPGSKNSQREGFAGGLLIGASLGLVWTPCVGPIMASVISLAITQNVDGGSVIIILAYALGTAIPMTAVMLGGRKLIKRFPALTKNPARLQRVFAVLMILVGLSIGFGIDRKFQSFILDVFPRYGTGLTALENIAPVRKALEERDSTSLGESDNISLSNMEPPRNGRLGDYGPAPQWVSQGPWLNTDSLPPGVLDDGILTMEELRGKVVLVDFWTYSCVNCVRTMPFLRAWDDAYRDQGLIILGVHAPEFAFEREEKNVRKAMDELGVTWPVVLDNSFAQWRAYQNRYWPAKYFIDARGNIRYFHFGEGEYDDSEKVIRKLLTEAGMELRDRAEKLQEQDLESRTPETYLGYGRSENFMNQPELLKNQPRDYSLIKDLEKGQWSLQGLWTVEKESILSSGEGTLEMEFHAKDLYLVIEPLEEDLWIDVYIDGRRAEDTVDVIGGRLTPQDSRLYHLIDLKDADMHRLELRVKGQLRMFAFTFG